MRLKYPSRIYQFTKQREKQVMAIYKYGDRNPKIGKGSFISDSSIVIGDVTIGRNCYWTWFNFKRRLWGY